MSSELDRAVRTAALALPSVETGIACPGTKMEALTYRVGKKNFAFVSGDDVRLKRADGWVKVTVAEGAAVPKHLASWIAESYTLVVAPPKKKPAARTKRKVR